MANNVTFHDFTIEVTGQINDNVYRAVEEAAAEVESAVKRNTRVDTGYTKNSWQHKVTGSGMAGEIRGYIGSDYENAIWEEFGTGEHALNGNGRQGGWRYKDANGDWHFTRGKNPSRAFFKAYQSTKSIVEKIIKNSLKGL